MAEPIELEVHGIPYGMGPKSGVIRGGRVQLIDGSTSSARKGLEAWRGAIADEVRAYLREHPETRTIREPVALELRFRLPSPKSDPYRTRHVSKPDLDHLVRSSADSLVKAGLLQDDALIWAIQARKVYAHRLRPGCWLRITPQGVGEAQDRAHLKERARQKRQATKASA